MKKQMAIIIVKISMEIEQTKEEIGMNKLLKILLLIMVAFSVVGCELLSPKEWKKTNQAWREKGVRCYEEANGNYYCKDKYGNRY